MTISVCIPIGWACSRPRRVDTPYERVSDEVLWKIEGHSISEGRAKLSLIHCVLFIYANKQATI